MSNREPKPVMIYFFMCAMVAMPIALSQGSSSGNEESLRAPMEVSKPELDEGAQEGEIQGAPSDGDEDETAFV